MNKLERDNRKAKQDRARVTEQINKFLEGTPFSLSPHDPKVTIHPIHKLKSLNNSTNRYSSAGHESGLMGHTHYIIDGRDNRRKRIELRSPYGDLFYKGCGEKNTSFEAMMAQEPNFLVWQEDRYRNIYGLAFFPHDHPYINRKSYWYKLTSKGNRNRLVNIKIRQLKDQVGFRVKNGKCPDFVEALYKLFKK